ncbi:biotin--[acetyl-CoA-carboxylase] ligase [Winogradskyella sp. PG-2]|uniref:biotin--[acetyl-CoA-carboxylase] ligase n=1 Tax=Winogradskyella sp. PG-2 TaxID=754409 RepID=UPI0004588B88|nr:biotin--[acetyl-CoA-carboxylase] ligase [Winogradskyella sp. PG-2]BAO74731.1 biotin-protein ligase [Winogradskyella sp. PG-2]
MYIIKLNAIDSTNAFLKLMAAKTLPKDYTVVSADLQTEGRGQMGTNWEAEEGKNLTASVFKALPSFEIEKQFYISMVVSLAICKALTAFNIPKLSIKWPNDILSEDKKICGILIENVIKHNQLEGSVIGIGMNINQKYFENLPQASSMSLVSGIIYNKDEVLSEILKQLQYYFEILETHKLSELKLEYESILFRKDKPSTFQTKEGETFSGIIKGVKKSGKLKVWTEDEIIKTFDLKDLKLLY